MNRFKNIAYFFLSFLNSDFRRKFSLFSPILILVIISLLSFFRAPPWKSLQTWGLWYWHIDYSHGFIKRAFIGTLVSPFLKDLTPYTVEIFIISQHLFFCFLLGLGLLYLTWENIRSPSTRTFLIWLCLGTSQFLPTLAYNCGYLDIHLCFIFLMAMFAVYKKHYITVGILGVIGSLIHELFLFFWIPVLTLDFSHSKSSPGLLRILGLSMPFLSQLFIFFFHSPEAAEAAIMGLSVIDLTMKEHLISVQMGQTIFASLQNMLLNHFAVYPINSVIGFLYFLSPAYLMIGLAYSHWKNHYKNYFLRSFALCFATFAPLSALLLAWDFSRLLVLSIFFCGVTFSFLDKEKKA
jgi:hypothetical protein